MNLHMPSMRDPKSSIFKSPSPRYPQVTKTTGLSDYLSRKKKVKSPRESKWQWLTLAALVLSLPAILFSVQNKLFDFVKGSQGSTATAVIVPYDSEMTDFQDYRVLMHLPDNITDQTSQANITVLFDTAHLELEQITPIQSEINVSSVENSNQNGQISVYLPNPHQTGLVSILEMRFRPKTGLPAYTQLTISPNSFIRMNNNQTKLIKGNSASVKIIKQN